MKNRKESNTKKTNIMAGITTYLSIPVNALSCPIKRHRMAGYIKKQGPTICCL
jgi:hypothetical protein